jgi:hypothetical protein
MCNIAFSVHQIAAWYRIEVHRKQKEVDGIPSQQAVQLNPLIWE